MLRLSAAWQVVAISVLLVNLAWLTTATARIDRAPLTKSSNESTSNATSESHEEDRLAIDLAVVGTCALLALIIGAALEEWKQVGAWIPATGAYILVGVAAGALFLAGGVPAARVRENYGLNPPVFFLLLLPPIIFDGAFAMKQLYFWRNIVSIGLFAVLGTLISTVVVALPTYFLNRDEFGVGSTMAYSGLISATDPVAALAVFGSVGVSERLFSTVFGEATCNDAVAIVIYSVAVELIDHEFGGSTVVVALVEFCLAFFGSIGIGLGISIVAALFFKHSEFVVQNHLVASLLIQVVGFLAFIVAETAHCSGIISTLICAFSMRLYALRNLTKESQLLALHLSRTIATLAETIVYVQIGFTTVGLTNWDWVFIVTSIVWIVVGRAIAVVSLSLIIALLSSDHNPPLRWTEQLVIWHAGLRGAIALSLALTIPHISDDLHEKIITATTAVIIWTVFFNGGTTAALLRLTGEGKVAALDNVDHCSACKARQVKLTTGEHRSLAFDEKWIRPLLCHTATGQHQQDDPDQATDTDRHSSSEFVPTRPVDTFVFSDAELPGDQLTHDISQYDTVSPRRSSYPRVGGEQRSHRNLLQIQRDDDDDEETLNEEQPFAASHHSSESD